MDMNMTYGGFIITLINAPTWVMNSYACNKLAIFYDKGIIKRFQD